jgi:hypothetical protein
MTYFDSLHPWCIVHFLPNMRHRIIARFRRRNDADAHLRVLRQYDQHLDYKVVFDAALEQSDLAVDGRSIANL